MIWIAVDKFGKRFMDEYPPAPQDTGTRALEFYDADIQDSRASPAICCSMERAEARTDRHSDRQRRALRRHWGRDNLAEMEEGWVKKGISLEDVGAQIEVDRKVLRETVDRGTRSAAEAQQRPQTPAEADDADQEWTFLCHGSLAHRQQHPGRPRAQRKQRVLDPMEKPIPRLYVAGEISSISGIFIWKREIFPECFVAGKIAGQNAAAEETSS